MRSPVPPISSPPAEGIAGAQPAGPISSIPLQEPAPVLSDPLAPPTVPTPSTQLRPAGYQDIEQIAASTQQPDRNSTLTIALLVILVLFLLLSSSGIAYFAAVAHPAQMNAQATAVAGTVLTKQAQGTALANAQATATVAAMNPQELYAWATSGTPVINDPLNNVQQSIWYHGAGSTGECGISQGAYHIKVVVPNSAAACDAYDSYFHNLAFQVQVTILAGDGGGLAFDIGAGFYLFLIGPNGAYLLVSGTNLNSSTLTSGASQAINQGLNQSNLLTAIDLNGQIYLYVNKQPVAHVNNNSYLSGQVALYAVSATTSTDVAFTNAEVWSL